MSPPPQIPACIHDVRDINVCLFMSLRDVFLIGQYSADPPLLPGASIRIALGPDHSLVTQWPVQKGCQVHVKEPSDTSARRELHGPRVGRYVRAGLEIGDVEPQGAKASSI